MKKGGETRETFETHRYFIDLKTAFFRTGSYRSEDE